MNVLQRDYIGLIVIAEQIDELIVAFRSAGPRTVSVEHATLAFPRQPYAAAESDLPMIIWSPSCAPHLTAFMPQIQSGDYFVAQYAHSRFGLPVVEIRSTTQSVEWPINEFIVHTPHVGRRIVRAMRDSPRWQFYADGAPLPFERAENYKRRQVRDRLKREDILTYLDAWGAPVQVSEFWCTSQKAYTFLRNDA